MLKRCALDCDSAIRNNAALEPDTDCNMNCAGNAAQKCGGPNRITVYAIDFLLDPCMLTFATAFNSLEHYLLQLIQEEILILRVVVMPLLLSRPVFRLHGYMALVMCSSNSIITLHPSNYETGIMPMGVYSPIS